MKTRAAHLSLTFLIISLLLIGCQQHQQGISNVNIGKDNEKKGSVGQPLSIQADIKSDTELEQIELTISSDIEQDWNFSDTFKDNIAGKSEVKFSADIDVPTSAKPGKYSLTLKAVKSDGTADQKSEEFSLVIDSSVPVVSDMDIGLNAAKNDLHLEAEITAAKKIKQIIVVIQGDAWNTERVFDGSKVEGKVSYHLHEHVHVDEAPEGSYQVVMTVEDQEGRKASNKGTFTK